MTVDEWLRALAAALDIEPPSSDVAGTLLEIAGIAAHASERQAAPISCWLIGTAGLEPSAALALVRDLASLEPPA
jgi:hypothetical protein